jgi:hypothetical protein
MARSQYFLSFTTQSLNSILFSQSHDDCPQDVATALKNAHRTALGFITDTLSHAISEANLVQSFHRIIGAIPILEEPCSPRTLDRLLNLESGEVTRVLSKLHSLTVVPLSDDDPIEPLHPSFLEYVMDSKLCNNQDLIIDPGVQQIELALACFKRMERGTLDQSWSSTTSHVEVGVGLPDVHMDVRYACLHWVTHLSRSPAGEPTLVAAMDVFLSRHLHYWLTTTLTLSGGIKSAISILQLLGRTWFPVSAFLVSNH